MPRTLNISAVDDDDIDSGETTNTPGDQGETLQSSNPSTTRSHGFPGVESVSAAHTYPFAKTELHNKKQHNLFLKICNRKHHHHQRDSEASETEAPVAEDVDADLLRFGVGTYGESEQELEREKVKLKGPRYGRKQLAMPALRRRESVYDRLRRSSSFMQQTEDGAEAHGMRNLTNEKVARRSTKKADERRKSLQVKEPQQPSGEPGSTPSLPPIIAVREEKGGVLDAYGYFSTHRVNPYYYQELDHRHPSYSTSSHHNGSSMGADGSGRTTKTEHRKSFMSAKVDAATRPAGDGEQRYATKRYEESQSNRSTDERMHNRQNSMHNNSSNSRCRGTRQESLYDASRPAVKAM